MSLTHLPRHSGVKVSSSSASAPPGPSSEKGNIEAYTSYNLAEIYRRSRRKKSINIEKLEESIDSAEIAPYLVRTPTDAARR